MPQAEVVERESLRGGEKRGSFSCCFKLLVMYRILNPSNHAAAQKAPPPLIISGCCYFETAFPPEYLDLGRYQYSTLSKPYLGI